MVYYFVFLIVVFLYVEDSLCQLSVNREELLNWCLKSKNHKSKPGKEDFLHGQCQPWKEHSCCTESVARDVHELNLYNFTFDHCHSQVKRNLSAQCRQHFIKDNCFYECEPHIGFWVVNTTRKISSERFYKVPLCASDCDDWFEACKNDFTCAYNWPQDFTFKNGRNMCPEDSKCVTFKDMYRTAKDFCENVWDHSWSYTEEEPCMRLNDGAHEKNRMTAEYYIDKAFTTNKASGPLLSFAIIGFVLVVSWKITFSY